MACEEPVIMVEAVCDASNACKREYPAQSIVCASSIVKHATSGARRQSAATLPSGLHTADDMIVITLDDGEVLFLDVQKHDLKRSCVADSKTLLVLVSCHLLILLTCMSSA